MDLSQIYYLQQQKQVTGQSLDLLNLGFARKCNATTTTSRRFRRPPQAEESSERVERERERERERQNLPGLGSGTAAWRAPSSETATLGLGDGGVGLGDAGIGLGDGGVAGAQLGDGGVGPRGTA
jgi:hypothetical protein